MNRQLSAHRRALIVAAHACGGEFGTPFHEDRPGSGYTGFRSTLRRSSAVVEAVTCPSRASLVSSSISSPDSTSSGGVTSAVPAIVALCGLFRAVKIVVQPETLHRFRPLPGKLATARRFWN